MGQVKTPGAARGNELLSTLKKRFEENPQRHQGISWEQVQRRLEANPDSLAVLEAMEATGGKPDVIGHNEETGQISFCDCSPQSPTGRRGICYDRPAQEGRKKHPPADNAMDMAAAIGIDMLTEEQYHQLQQLGEFDTKTSSWLQTPEDIRQRGGAIFGDRRYGRVFIYHNGADSYYSARGFRGMLKV